MATKRWNDINKTQPINNQRCVIKLRDGRCIFAFQRFGEWVDAITVRPLVVTGGEKWRYADEKDSVVVLGDTDAKSALLEAVHLYNAVRLDSTRAHWNSEVDRARKAWKRVMKEATRDG